MASPAFVGRAAELAALNDALDAVEEGQTTTVLISGDAGVGKTRLLQAWNENAVHRGAHIAAGSCLDLGETGPAYAAVVEALRELLGAFDPDDEDALLGQDRGVLARLAPELGRDDDPPSSERHPAAVAQTRLFERIVDVLQRAAESGPVVLELEDIHWADRSSQAFLLYLVEVSRRSRLLVIGTYRPEVADVDQTFRTTLAQLQRRPRVATLPVAPFDEAELREQLSGILGRPPSRALLAAIHARSEGNALFAEELAATRDPRMDLPASVSVSTASKVDGLSVESRAVLRAASVVGRTATYEVLRNVTELSDDALGAALRVAVEARLLEPVHSGEGYRFRHALLQEAIYNETLPGERRRLHEAVAHALSKASDSASQDPDLAPRLARHWYEARALDQAFLASRAAAAAAEGQSAYAEAAFHYERLLELWEDAGAASYGLTRAGLCERAARNAFLASDFDRSARHGWDALAELGRTPDDDMRVRVLDQLTWTLENLGQDPGEVIRQAAAVEIEGRSPHERLLIHFNRALSLAYQRRYGDAMEVLRPLVAQAQAEGDLPTFVNGSIQMAGLLVIYDVDAAIDTLEPVRELARGTVDPVLETDLHLGFCEMLLVGERHEQLLAASAVAEQVATHAGLGRWARPTLRYQLASSYLRIGQLVECRKQVELAVEDEPSGRYLALLQFVAGLASTAMGDFEDAGRHLETARIPDPTAEEELRRAWLATARARLALAERRFDLVEQTVEATASRILDDGPNANTDTVWWLAEVELAAGAERAETARAAHDEPGVAEAIAIVERATGYVDVARHQLDEAGIPEPTTTRGYDDLIAGQIARIEGRDEPGRWASAAEQFPPQSIEALSSRYRQAEAMLATRTPREEVREVMAPAHAAAVAIGARPLTSRFEALGRRARIDLRPPTGSEPTASGPAESVPAESTGEAALKNRGLSSREIEVLTLVAAGFSNAEIADRLFISSKTASVHVSHILDKLGVSTRTEAATVGVRLGLPEVDA